jgi:hypothetical protein
MQEFSNFENFQFVKNTKFSKFSQNLSFYYRDLRPKKKLLQFTQRITKKIWLESENMVPDREIAGCFRKYLPCSFVAYRKIAAYKCKNFLVFQNVISWKT